MIRVLIVDDSALVRNILSEELRRFADIDVVGTATDPFVARDRILELRPDVVTLDVEMPRMDGLSFLERLMRHHPIPVVIVSSLTPEHSEGALRALELGAVEVVCKPGSAYSVPEVGQRLVHAIRAAALARLPAATAPAQTRPVAPPAALHQLRTTNRILAIGASTGGTKAIEAVLRALPASAPGTVIVQHMPAGFTRSFADRLNTLCAMEVREARDGDLVSPGLALIAPGNLHMVVQRSGAQFVARLKDGPPVHHQRPAVDILFHSVARAAGRNAVGVILTGMGADGAKGLRAMFDAGAWTIAQNEATCVVYGMPREAVTLGAAREIEPLDRIAPLALDALYAGA
jgi:two-component system, chemotaxis family, protein-glutamate methylesterase/glutaminase